MAAGERGARRSGNPNRPRSNPTSTSLYLVFCRCDGQEATCEHTAAHVARSHGDGDGRRPRADRVRRRRSRHHADGSTIQFRGAAQPDRRCTDTGRPHRRRRGRAGPARRRPVRLLRRSRHGGRRGTRRKGGVQQGVRGPQCRDQGEGRPGYGLPAGVAVQAGRGDGGRPPDRRGRRRVEHAGTPAAAVFRPGRSLRHRARHDRRPVRAPLRAARSRGRPARRPRLRSQPDSGSAATAAVGRLPEFLRIHQFRTDRGCRRRGHRRGDRLGDVVPADDLRPARHEIDQFALRRLRVPREPGGGARTGRREVRAGEPAAPTGRAIPGGRGQLLGGRPGRVDDDDAGRRFRRWLGRGAPGGSLARHLAPGRPRLRRRRTRGPGSTDSVSM